jgi:UDP-glucose 4-epimerase
MATVLVTGGAGFIGCHIVRALLKHGYAVRVIDDFSSGRRDNLAEVADDIDIHAASICDVDLLATAFNGVDSCIHLAAIPSVPRSIESPSHTNRVNVEGTLNVFQAARSAGIRRVVFASSSAVYGNVASLPVSESNTVAPISPYGVSKAAAEMYASTLSDVYDMDIVALRYFNVFGPHQDPRSQYAAVIPIFLSHMFGGKAPPINGDGLQSRDFSYVDNVVSANLKAIEAPEDVAGAYNIACSQTTSIVELVNILNELLNLHIEPAFRPTRVGDIVYSRADITKARNILGYEPTVDVREGLLKTLDWFRQGEGI